MSALSSIDVDKTFRYTRQLIDDFTDSYQNILKIELLKELAYFAILGPQSLPQLKIENF